MGWEDLGGVGDGPGGPHSEVESIKDTVGPTEALHLGGHQRVLLEVCHEAVVAERVAGQPPAPPSQRPPSWGRQGAGHGG